MIDNANERHARQERAATTHQQILEAATDCFAQRGYDGTSTAEIAKAAGVSQGTIFHHFATKEGLFSAILRGAIDSFKERVAAAQQQELSPRERIQLVMHLVGEMTLEHPARTDIIICQVLSMRLDPQKVEAFGLMEVIAAIRDVFEQGKRSGAFSDVDTQTAALSILGIYLANYVGWSALGRSYDFVHALGRACTMFLDGIARA